MASQKSSRGPGRRYSTFVGIAFLVLIIVATLNTIRTQGGGTLGVGGAERGIPLSEFAVPNAVTGPLDFDANIAQDNCSTSENPCPSDAKRTPACEINYPPSRAIRVCDLFSRPLVLSFWFTRGANCLPTQDALNAVYEKYKGRLNVLSIDVRDDPSSVRSIASEHRWTMPVGIRPRRRCERPLQGRRVSDGRVRVPGRDPRLREGEHRRALAAADRVRKPARRDRARRQTLLQQTREREAESR